MINKNNFKRTTAQLRPTAYLDKIGLPKPFGAFKPF